MKASRSEPVIDFSYFSNGLNTNESQFGIKEGQAYKGSINAKFKSIGFMRAPGFWGLSATPPFTTYCKGLNTYSRTDGTEKLMGFSNGKLYEIDPATNLATERYNLTGLGEGYGASAYDRFFAVNGTGSCFVANTTGYQIGITPPAACTVAAAAGGSLADGVYNIYVSYAIKDSGLNVLYSQGFLCASVTLGSGNNTIAFSGFANSSNSRVNNKVVWISGPTLDSGSYFFYYETNNNTSTSFNISDYTARDSSKYYNTLALPSKVPPVMTGIIFHDDYLYGWKDNVIYMSMKATSVYDLERWPDNTYSFPFYILSLFTIGADLFLNTNQGIMKIEKADMTSRWIQVTKRLYFKYIRTIAKLDDTTGAEYDSPVIGWTNDGIRIFDGTGFSIDLSKDVKSEIQTGMNNSTSVFQPCGYVCRSNGRSEYRISYRDIFVNALMNNRQLVLNLDTLTISSNTEFTAAWEQWTTGFAYSCTMANNTVYMAQSLDGASQIFTEKTDSCCDKWIYNDAGALIVVLTNKLLKVVSKAEIVDIVGRIQCEQIRLLAQLGSSATISVEMGDEFSVKDINSVLPSGGKAVNFDEVNFDEAYFPTEQPILTVKPLKASLKGTSCFITFEQTGDDSALNVISIKIYVSFEQGHHK